MNEMDSIVKEFVVESNENLDRLDRELVELEKNPFALETLASIFRTIHSIKGATGFLGFSKLGAVAHAGESLLSSLRDRVLVINPEITSGLLTLVDCIRQMLSQIDKTGTEGGADYSALVEHLSHLQTTGNTLEAAPAPITAISGMENSLVANTDAPDHVVVPAKSHDEPAVDRADESDNTSVSPGAPKEQAVEPGPMATMTSGARSAPAKTPTEQKETSHATHSSGNIRVDVSQLDVLMNLVGELVLTRNEMLQLVAGQQDSVVLTTSQRLNFLTTQLQEGIMKTRMLPIDNVWKKFPRVVRDLAIQRGKEVRLEMEGNDTELDKTVIEAIQDPLTHLIRNSIDHGLEAPDQRIAAGKAAEGRLWLRAFHEGGQVNIEVSDDGAGIDLGSVKRKAIERGMITSEYARLMDEQEVINLIFLPGFSTAAKVTNLSGRGVGMDVVKTNIEKIGGKVSMQTRPGLGTTMKIRIPLTLAIMPALVVTAGGERYAIPQVSVLELVRLEGDEVRKGIELIHDAAVYRLRGNLLPLIWLDAELRGGIRNPDQRNMKENDAITIVVLLVDDCKFGLVVDEVNDTEEIVVKPLAKQLRGISTFAGASIMGNRRVVLILDVLGLAVHANLLSELHDPNPVRSEMSFQARSEERQALLVFAGPDDVRMAVQLSKVTRLEIFPCSSLERMGDQDVVQYHGEILPLVKISNLLPERRHQPRGLPRERKTDAMIQVVIYLKDGRHVGLVVDNILDTVEQSPADLGPPSRKGVVASAVIEGRVTEILDLDVLCGGPAFASLTQQPIVEAKA
jgi:two-component system, chemotaxis family, sensor kinase CheA